LKVKKIIDGDPEAREMWQRAYGDLHMTLLSGCRSPLLLKIYKDVGARLERYVNLFADLESDRYYDHHADHRLIVEAIVARDGERTQALIEGYFAVADPIRRSIIGKLKQMEAPSPKASSRIDTVP
jgi:GntR family carbon starvation induced transcriptional regulator